MGLSSFILGWGMSLVFFGRVVLGRFSFINEEVRGSFGLRIRWRLYIIVGLEKGRSSWEV